VRPYKALRGGFKQAKIYSNKKGFTFGNVLHFTQLKLANKISLGVMQNFAFAKP